MKGQKRMIKKKGQRQLALGRPNTLQPPQLSNPELHQTMRLRFRNNTNSTANLISWTNLLDAVAFATSSTVLYELFDYCRIKMVEMWAVQSNGQVLTIGVDFGNVLQGYQGAGNSYEATTMGNAIPAHLVARPDPKSQAAQWHSADSSTAFHIRTSGGSATTIVDVALEFRNSQVTNPVVVAGGAAGATTGEFYWRGLDGNPIGSTAWTPLTGPNTI